MEIEGKTTTNETPKPKSDTKVDGVSSQINLGTGSPTHLRFARLMNEAGVTSVRDFCNILMDAYEKPGSDEETAQAFNELHQTIDSRNAEIGELQKTIGEKDAKISELEANLKEACRMSNENAENGLGKQLQLDELRQRIDGAIIIKPNPVVKHFLDEMAGKTGTTPDKILEKLFIDDLQNPMSNNLPYIVTSSEIRRVMRELKAQQQ